MQDLQNATKQLADSKKILLTISDRATYDETSSLIALGLFLADQDKKVVVSIPRQTNGTTRDLLKRFRIRYSKELDPLSYIISIPYEKGEIEKLSYDTKDGKVNLYITPGRSEFDFENVRYAVAGSNFDTIVVIGCRSLKWLKGMYSKNQKIFDRSTIINLNNKRGSQEFGDIKLTDATKQTVSEVVYEIISLLGGSQNKNIIDVLAEGMIAGTDLLQRGSISSSSMEIITNLISAGANIKTSVNRVYFSNPMGNFNLAKKLFEDIKKDEASGVVWATVNLASFNDTGANKDEVYYHTRIPFNITRKFKIAFVLYEIENGKVRGIIESNRPTISAADIARQFNGKGTRGRAEFLYTGKSVAELEQGILATIQKLLGGEIKSEDPIGSPASPAGTEPQDEGAIISKGVKVEKNDETSTFKQGEGKRFVSPPQLKETDEVPLGAPGQPSFGPRKAKSPEKNEESEAIKPFDSAGETINLNE